MRRRESAGFLLALHGIAILRAASLPSAAPTLRSSCERETIFFSGWEADYSHRALTIYNPTSEWVSLDGYGYASCGNGCDHC